MSKITVYPITSGYADDFELIGIASSEEKAKEFMDQFPGEEFNHPGPMIVDDLVKIPPGKYPYTVRFDKDKNITDVYRNSIDLYWASEIENLPVRKFTDISDDVCITVSLWASDMGEAMRLAKDMKDVVVDFDKV